MNQINWTEISVIVTVAIALLGTVIGFYVSTKVQMNDEKIRRENLDAKVKEMETRFNSFSDKVDDNLQKFDAKVEQKFDKIMEKLEQLMKVKQDKANA